MRMNLARQWANAMHRRNMRSVANVQAFMTPEQLTAGQRLLADLRIKARRKP